jgi:tRNA1(Val) A37 N6-methylase TrmN6
MTWPRPAARWPTTASTLASDEALTRDAALDGRLWLWQPARGFRFGIDAVLLAAAVPARPGDRVLELGCGVGAAVLSLATRLPGLTLTGVEAQAPYATLAARNAAENGIALRVVTADLTALPAPVRAESFDQILMNPPYFDRAAGVAARDAGRDTALAGATPLADWITTAARRLAPRGTLTVIQRSARLTDLLAALAGRLGSVSVLPLQARAGRAPEHVILRARKDGRAPFRLLAPLVLHAGATHESDAENYAPAIQAVLRKAAALPWVD